MKEATKLYLTDQVLRVAGRQETTMLKVRDNWEEKSLKSVAWEAYATRPTDATMHKFAEKFCNNWLPVGQRLIK
jgi:hypothetical protein